MATTSDQSVAFDHTDTRDDEMHSTYESRVDDLVEQVQEARTSQEFLSSR